MGNRILIAEDSATQAQQLQHLLAQQGYDARIALDGSIAFDMARSWGPDLVISDVVMPEIDGYELSSRLKADPLLKDTPVILVTAMSDPRDVLRGLECGADNFVLKPFEDNYLLGRIRYVLLNREMRRRDNVGMGVEVYFNNQRHFITADRLQILNLLLSTYEAAMQRNKELLRSQEELQFLNARLEAANRELESFSYSVSHDLRAPLRHIDGYVTMLGEETKGRLPPGAERCLQVISEASRQMNELIEGLLAFSRTGRAAMREERVRLDAVVREAVGVLEMAARGRSVEWRIAPLPVVYGDASMLRQVFVNLLDNALKYSRKRDRARIEVGIAGHESQQVVLFVRDNGVGFDMQYAGKLFGVFQRLHTREEFEGTGIGLATVQRIIIRHGGRIWAQAEPDAGATFYFTLNPRTSPDLGRLAGTSHEGC